MKRIISIILVLVILFSISCFGEEELENYSITPDSKFYYPNKIEEITSEYGDVYTITSIKWNSTCYTEEEGLYYISFDITGKMLKRVSSIDDRTCCCMYIMIYDSNGKILADEYKTFNIKYLVTNDDLVPCKITFYPKFNFDYNETYTIKIWKFK